MPSRYRPNPRWGLTLLEQTDEWAVQRARYMPRDTLSEITEQPAVALPAMAN